MVESNPLQSKIEEKILFVNFNQNNSCFAVGTEKGFHIFNSNPFKEIHYRNFDAGIGRIEMLYRTNILALVGGGKNPKFAQNKIIIWDDLQGRVISELRFTTNVRNVKMKRERIFAVCETKIFIFQFSTFENIEIIETFLNPKGVIAISANIEETIIAYPDQDQGYVRIKFESTQPPSLLLNAHESQIAFLSINLEGSIIATSSDKGTLIRLFRIKDGTLIQELRRGTENAQIYSLAFDDKSSFIACSSDRGTIHIFSLNPNKSKEEDDLLMNAEENTGGQGGNKGNTKNHRSIMGKITGFFGVQKGYFNSEWSFAKLRIGDTGAICCINEDNTLIVIGDSGKYYKAKFDPHLGGECSKVQEEKIGFKNN